MQKNALKDTENARETHAVPQSELIEGLGAAAKYCLMPAEPTDEMIRVMLAVEYPASYREYLRHPWNGPKTSEENEKRIIRVKSQYAALMSFMASNA